MKQAPDLRLITCSGWLEPLEPVLAMFAVPKGH